MYGLWCRPQKVNGGRLNKHSSIIKLILNELTIPQKALQVDSTELKKYFLFLVDTQCLNFPVNFISGSLGHKENSKNGEIFSRMSKKEKVQLIYLILIDQKRCSYKL